MKVLFVIVQGHVELIIVYVSKVLEATTSLDYVHIVYQSIMHCKNI